MRSVLGAVAPGRRPGAWVAAVCLALVVGVVPGPIAAADSVSDRKHTLDQQLAKLRTDLEGTSADLVAAAVALKRSQAELVDARAALATAQAALAAAVAKDEELAGRLAFAAAEQTKASRDLGRSQAEETQTRTTLGLIAREAYLSSGMSGLAIALEAQSPADFSERLAVAGTALRSQNAAIARLDVEQAETRARRVKLAALKAQVADLKRQSEATVKARKAAQHAAQAAEARVAALVAEQAHAVAVIEARKAAEQARVAAMAKEQAKLKAILLARARAAARRHHLGGGPSGTGFLSMPAAGPITSGFGMRFHPILHIWRMHTGTDFGVGCGTPVHAAADGTVIMAGWAGGYGNRVVVDHGIVRGVSLATTYNHLTSIVVHSGHVRRGQVIAYSGTTGTSTGCHLHFEVLVNGSFVNPMGWL